MRIKRTSASLLFFCFLNNIDAKKNTSSFEKNGYELEMTTYYKMTQADVNEVSAFVLGKTFQYSVMSDSWQVRFHKPPTFEACYGDCGVSFKKWQRALKRKWSIQLKASTKNYVVIMQSIYHEAETNEYSKVAITTSKKLGVIYIGFAGDDDEINPFQYMLLSAPPKSMDK